MTASLNPYAGLPHAELVSRRRDHAKMLHAAAAVRKAADKHLQLIREAMRDDGGTREFEASDHAVIRYLERVQGVDINAIRDTITFNCANGVDLIGDKMRGCDGFLYCLNSDGHITTILPLDAVIDEAAEMARAQRSGAVANGKKRRSHRAKLDFIASCDTQPKAGDVKQAPLVSGAAGSEASETPEAKSCSSPQPEGG